MKSKCRSIIKFMNLKSENGSSSVLVIMIMLLLITFGVLAMMSSYSNLKIARKHAEWTKSYYQLESIAEKNSIDFENLYKKAAKEMDNFVAVDLPEAIAVSQLPELVKDTLNGDIEAGKINLVKQKLFLYLLYDNFNSSSLFQMNPSLSFNYDIINQEITEDWNAQLSYITLDENSGRQLLTSYKIDSVNYGNLPVIDQWRELPQEFQYDEGINFNDPEGN